MCSSHLVFRVINTYLRLSLMKNLIAFIRNKYLLAGSAFIIWMLFFDHNDVFSQMQDRRELQELKEEKEYFEQQINENRDFSNNLQFNASAIEKYAREKYLMKRDNEDLYLIEPAEGK